MVCSLGKIAVIICLNTLASIKHSTALPSPLLLFVAMAISNLGCTWYKTSAPSSCSVGFVDLVDHR